MSSLISSSCFSSSKVLYPKWLAQRAFLTGRMEVQLVPSSPIQERPCTVVLAEDTGIIFGGSSLRNSWDGFLSASLPGRYGMEYAYWKPTDVLGKDTHHLQELRSDMESIAHCSVLIARGPYMCSLAQFYLESQSLAGLVMVDPFDVTRDDIDNICAEYVSNVHAKPTLTEEEQATYQHCLLRQSALQRKLEPAPVPALVLSTFPSNATWTSQAMTMARFFDARMITLATDDDIDQLVADFIDEGVL